MPKQANLDFSERERELDYELRVSSRARRLTLRVLPGRGLVVTVPRRYPRRDIAVAVESHRDWVVATLAALEAKLPLACREWPPRVLELGAIERRIVLGIGDPHGPAAGGSSLDAESVWLIDSTPDDRAAVASTVLRRLKREGRHHLAPRLEQLSARHGLRYRQVSIRAQRSVWGSYSSSGTLSLNCKLLFLRPGLVDYVLLHELAHTRHLDHSAAFWRLLETLAPGAKALDAELRTAGCQVPPWLELAR